MSAPLKGSCVGKMYCCEADMLLVESWADDVVGGCWYEPNPVLVNRVVCDVFCESRSDGLSSRVDDMAIDETVDGKSEQPALNPGQNMLPSTSGRPGGSTDFWRAGKPGPGPCAECPGKTTWCGKALFVKRLLGVSEAAVLGLVSAVAEVVLKCGSKTGFCLRDGSFFHRAKSFILEPRLRFRWIGPACIECGNLQPIHCDQSFSFVGKLCEVLHRSQSNSPPGSSGHDKRC